MNAVVFVALVVLALVILCVAAYKLNIALYKPQHIWDVAIFTMEKDADIINQDYSHPDTLFSPWQFIRRKYHYTTGYADPFLFVKDDYLYLFYEKEIFDGNGVINAKRTKDLNVWEDQGTVLSEPFHLSYPNVFEHNGDIYMLPEMGTTRTVTLYKAHNFPYEWKAEKVLLDGHKFADSDLFEKDGTWYLFTTIEVPERPYGMRLYTSAEFDGEYKEHPLSPLLQCSTLANWRCGGSVFSFEGKLYRPAQRFVSYYGDNLGLWEIKEISPDTYDEIFVRDIHKKPGNEWDKLGGHHFKSVIFNDKRVVVMDGLLKDSWINNRTRTLYKKS